MEKKKDDGNPSINHLAEVIELTKLIDSMSTEYNDLLLTVEDVVFRDVHNCWKLRPEISQLISGSMAQHLHLICMSSHTTEDVLAKLIESNYINLDKLKSQQDNTDNNNHGKEKEV